jgi:hypothetical protein
MSGFDFPKVDEAFLPVQQWNRISSSILDAALRQSCSNPARALRSTKRHELSDRQKAALFHARQRTREGRPAHFARP